MSFLHFFEMLYGNASTTKKMQGQLSIFRGNGLEDRFFRDIGEPGAYP
tara:strand:- start:742 stop:885 length:144 start_codon:yes stop_codon:yes gene_type:complete